MPRGDRESHWLVLRRCLAILRRVQRGPTDWHGLYDAVLVREGAEAYGGVQGDALHRRVENDLARIRDCLGIDVRFGRNAGGYALVDAAFPLLDLADDDLETVAWLEQVFQPNAPGHERVRSLIGRLRLGLAPERRALLDRVPTLIEVDLSRREEDPIEPAVLLGLCSALRGRRRIEFDYRPMRREAGGHYRVDPYRLYFNATESHYYLDAWCHLVRDERGEHDRRQWRTFRPDRMSQVQLLPDRLPSEPPPRRWYAVEYRLSPIAARRGVARPRWIEVHAIERHDDGGATVRGRTAHLFWTRRALLQYGPSCRVLGGEELLAEMREAVRGLAELYASPP